MNTAASDSTANPDNSASLFYPAEVESDPVVETETTDEAETDQNPENISEADADEVESVEEDDENADPDQSSDDELYVALSGEREVTLKQIKEWEKGALMQSDYTKKTQALADERRAFQAEPDKYVADIVAKRMEGFDDTLATMEALIKEVDESIDWEDLKNYDSSEYIKQKELKEKRQEAVENARKMRTTKPEMSKEEITKVQSELLQNNQNWLDADGKQTENHKADLKLLSEYMSERGYTLDDQKNIKTARDWQTLIDAARYRQSKTRAASAKVKLKQIPITTKPRAQTADNKKSTAELFYGK